MRRNSVATVEWAFLVFLEVFFLFSVENNKHFRHCFIFLQLLVHSREITKPQDVSHLAEHRQSCLFLPDSCEEGRAGLRAFHFFRYREVGPAAVAHLRTHPFVPKPCL